MKPSSKCSASDAINYLRISVTDRSNQRCFYCMPQGLQSVFKHSEILTYEEIVSIVAAAVKTGFQKFRITGGEPLVRKNICELIRKMVALPGVKEVVLTTNGVLLEGMAAELYAAGVRRLNISLDTLNPLKYFKITKKDNFHRVMRGIELARKVGMEPVKINVVVIRGTNDDELEEFGRWASQKSLSVRFIEYMPIGSRHTWNTGKFISVDDIRRRLERVMPLHPLRKGVSDGPAEQWQIGSTSGEIGLIGAVSHQFCQSCNRMRLTSEGNLRPCLMRDEEIDVKTPLRAGCDEAVLINLIQKAVAAKNNIDVTKRLYERHPSRAMSRIGG